MKKTFSIRWKLVLFVGVLAIVTYSTSFVFIRFLHPYFFSQFSIFSNKLIFEIITYLLGITWSCILAAVCSVVLTKPLEKLEKTATRVAEGKIGQDVEMPKTHDEIRSVAEAFQLMLQNLRQMVESIDVNFQKRMKPLLNYPSKQRELQEKQRVLLKPLDKFQRGQKLLQLRFKKQLKPLKM